MTDLEGRELDEALARAMGWYIHPDCRDMLDRPLPDCWHTGTPATRDNSKDVKDWHASLDALLRDIEPVCRERGMRRIALEQVGADEWVATILVVLPTRHVQRVFGEGPTAATALARAFLAVLTRGEM